MEKSIEEGDIAHTVRTALRWQIPRSSRRMWWMILAGLSAFAILVLFVHPPKYTSQSEALLDTVLNKTLGFQKIFVINLKTQTDRKDRLALAAALTGIDVEFMAAVTMDEVDRKAIPTTEKDYEVEKLPQKVFASWRSHMNAIEAIVEQNLGSALIIEDDADWDVRIKQQLRDYALTTRQLLQPLQDDRTQFLDPTYFKMNKTKYNEFMPADLHYTEWDYTQPAAPVLEPTDCAYGDLDRWDVLWLGHCGQRFAKPHTECNKTPLGRVLRRDDETVAETQWFRNFYSGNEYAETYENHTRVTHWSCAQLCNTAYAVSNQGAKKLLYDLGVRMFRGMSDAVLREACDGKDPFEVRTCVSVSPQFFNQWGLSRERVFEKTGNVRISTNGNMDLLVNEEGPLRDTFPDADTLVLP